MNVVIVLRVDGTFGPLSCDLGPCRQDGAQAQDRRAWTASRTRPSSSASTAPRTATLPWTGVSLRQRGRKLPLHLFSAGIRQMPGGGGDLPRHRSWDACRDPRSTAAAEERPRGGLGPCPGAVTRSDHHHEERCRPGRPAGWWSLLARRHHSPGPQRARPHGGRRARLGRVAGRHPRAVPRDRRTRVEGRGAPDARGVVVGIDGSAVSELALGYAFEQASLRGVAPRRRPRVVDATVAAGLTRENQDRPGHPPAAHPLRGTGRLVGEVPRRRGQGGACPWGPPCSRSPWRPARRAARRGQPRQGRVPQPAARLGQPGGPHTRALHGGRGARRDRRGIRHPP